MSLETIKNLKAKMAAVRAEMKALGRDSLQEAFDSFLAENPEVLGISWNQYTPYFNDGDTCEFGVNEPSLLLTAQGYKDLLDQDMSDEDAEALLEARWPDDYSYALRESKNARAQQLYSNFLEFIRNVVDDELYLATFGDHAKITVTRDGFKEEKCDHD